MRRMNLRDTAHNMNRRRMIRRGATYGCTWPTMRTRTARSAASRRSSCARASFGSSSLVQNVWVNDRSFHELGNERDPIIGTQDTLEYKIPKPGMSQDHGLPPLRPFAAAPTSSA
jgi:deferrochelatase/peroxidase EfeB